MRTNEWEALQGVTQAARDAAPPAGVALTEVGLFAGIGGFSFGFRRAGIQTVALVEIDRACQDVLRRHWPDVPIVDDVRACGAHNLPWANIVSFGFPCQDLSVAGRRVGLDGQRSGLFYEATRIVDELRPDYAIWENVPGLLSSGGGRDFHAVLSELDRIGYSGAWTCLDAQFFGLAQRRRRVFGVFARRDIGAARCAEILALAARLPWNTAPGRKAGQGVARTLTGGAPGGSTHGKPNGSDRRELVIAATLNSGGNHGGFRTEPGEHVVAYQCHGSNVSEMGTLRKGNGATTGGVPFLARSQTTREGERLDGESCTFVTHTLRAEGHDASEDGTGRGVPLVPYNIVGLGQQGRNHAYQADVTGAIQHKGNSASGNEAGTVIAFGNRMGATADVAETLRADCNGALPMASVAHAVRRLTPTECERLQGFPDGWTDGQADSTRYRQLGNAVAVPVATWIGRRILEVS